jgi:Ni,Fe-hydrogenase III large subunit
MIIWVVLMVSAATDDNLRSQAVGFLLHLVNNHSYYNEQGSFSRNYVRVPEVVASLTCILEVLGSSPGRRSAYPRLIYSNYAENNTVK